MIHGERLSRDLNGLTTEALRMLVSFGLKDRDHVLDMIRGRADGGPWLARRIGVAETALRKALRIDRWPGRAAVQLHGPCPIGGVPRARKKSVPKLTQSQRASLPTWAAMIDRYGEPRDQGPVGTCTAFAGAAVMEGQLNDTNLDLSEAFIYSLTKSIDGEDGDGSFLEFTTLVLIEYGACREESWPYRPDRDYLLLPPSPEALAEAENCKARARTELGSTDVDGIRAELAAGRPVGISVPIFPSTYNSLRFHNEGRFAMCLGDDDKADGGHAMCIVAYLDDAWLSAHGYEEDLGGGVFLVRNSWGRWAPENRLAAHFGAAYGYAIMPYAYVSSYAWEAFTVTLSATSAVRSRADWLAQFSQALRKTWTRTAQGVGAQSRERLRRLARR